MTTGICFLVAGLWLYVIGMNLELKALKHEVSELRKDIACHSNDTKLENERNQTH